MRLTDALMISLMDIGSNIAAKCQDDDLQTAEEIDFG